MPKITRSCNPCQTFMGHLSCGEKVLVWNICLTFRNIFITVDLQAFRQISLHKAMLNPRLSFSTRFQDSDELVNVKGSQLTIWFSNAFFFKDFCSTIPIFNSPFWVRKEKYLYSFNSTYRFTLLFLITEYSKHFPWSYYFTILENSTLV